MPTVPFKSDGDGNASGEKCFCSRGAPAADGSKRVYDSRTRPKRANYHGYRAVGI